MGKDGERGGEVKKRRDGGGINFITKLIPQTFVLSYEANGATHSRGLTLRIQPLPKVPALGCTGGINLHPQALGGEAPHMHTWTLRPRHFQLSGHPGS